MDSDTTNTSKNINEFEFESDFTAALSTFYNYKKEYDSKINKKIKEIHNNTELTKDDKKNKFLKMKKTCIIYGQSGGSILFQDKNKYTPKKKMRWVVSSRHKSSTSALLFFSFI